MKYLLSVIIPVYNCKKFLKRAVDSVINQRDFIQNELILVDDGSTDGSSEICDFYKSYHPNIKVIHQPNAGVSVARNAGLDCAEGEWICFVDSDDYLIDGALETALKFNDADLIFAKPASNGETQSVFDFGFDEGIYIKTEADGRLNDILAGTKIFYPCWSKLFKTEVIKQNKIKFPVGIKIAEDMVFVYTYLKFTEKIAFIKNEIYFYNVNEGNTTIVVPKSFDVNLYIFEWLKAYFNEIPCDKEKVFDKITSEFIYRAFDSVKIAAYSMSFFNAVKYVNEILNNEIFYTIYINNGNDGFNSKTDTLLNNLIIKKNPFMICLVVFINKIKSKIAAKS